MQIIRLLEFGMRNVKSKNGLLRILGSISISIAENYARRIERKSDRRQKNLRYGIKSILNVWRKRYGKRFLRKKK